MNNFDEGFIIRIEKIEQSLQNKLEKYAILNQEKLNNDLRLESLNRQKAQIDETLKYEKEYWEKKYLISELEKLNKCITNNIIEYKSNLCDIEGKLKNDLSVINGILLNQNLEISNLTNRTEDLLRGIMVYYEQYLMSMEELDSLKLRSDNHDIYKLKISIVSYKIKIIEI